MNTRHSLLSLSVVLLSCLLVAPLLAEQQAGGRRPNVLFLLSDDQRPDTIGALGNRYIETPNLDRLARRGVAITRATCANPICVPSRAEILTGMSGFRNGVLDFGRGLDTQLRLWPEAMQQNGYRTWYVGKWHTTGRPHQRGYQDTLGLFSGGGGQWWEDRTDWKGAPVTGYRGWVFQSSDGRQKYPERGCRPDGGYQQQICGCGDRVDSAQERRAVLSACQFHGAA